MRASKLFLAFGLLALGATAAIAQSLPAGVQVSGGILTDSKGMTLYVFDKDTPGVSNCYDKCAANRDDIRCEVFVYPLEVSNVADKWKEKGERKR